MPALRRHFPLVGLLAAVVERFLVDDIEHDFRIDVATSRTSAGLCVGIVGSLLEIGDGIDRITIENRISTFVEEPKPVEELINVA